MKNAYSLTYAGVLVSVLGYLFNKFGVPYEDGQIESVISNGIIALGWLAALYGRWRHADISFCGFKKKPGEIL